MNKRAVSHVEMILAFILFVFSIIIALSFIPPFGTSPLAETSQESLTRELIKGLTMPVIQQNIIVTPPVLNKTIAVNVPIPTQYGLRAETPNNTILAVRREANMVRFDWNSSVGTVVYLFAGNFSLAPAVSQSVAINESQYMRSSLFNYELISEELALISIRDYSTDYDAFKRTLKVPDSVDFGFSLSFGPNDRIEATRALPANAEVYAQTTRVEVLRLNGARSFAILEVRIW